MYSVQTVRFYCFSKARRRSEALLGLVNQTGGMSRTGHAYVVKYQTFNRLEQWSRVFVWIAEVTVPFLHEVKMP